MGFSKIWGNKELKPKKAKDLGIFNGKKDVSEELDKFKKSETKKTDDNKIIYGGNQ